MALTVIKPSGIDTSGNYTVNGMNVSANLSVANLSVTTSANLGNVGNVKITGGTGGYVLQTDGAGNLSWVAQGSDISRISNGNSNVNIPLANGNVIITAVGNTTLTVTGTGANISGTTNITGNLTAANIIAGSGSGGNITNANVISANTFVASSNITAGNANLGNAATANFFIGSGNNLSNIQGANVTGQVSNALISGTVYTNAQPNITSVGTLTSLTVTGNVTGGNLNTSGNVNAPIIVNGGTGIYLSAGPSGYINFFTTGGDKASISDTGNIIASNIIANSTVFATTANISGNVNAGNANLGNAATANFFIGSGNNLSNIQGANVTGQVSNALISGTVYTNAQPNITSVGSLTGLTVSNATGIVNFTTTANVTLGAVANLHISGGTNTYVLSTDGAGNLSWVAQSGGGSIANISNGNSNVNIPAANGNVNISAVGNANIVVVTGTGANINGTLSVTGQTNLGAVGNVVITGGTANYVLKTDGSGTLSWVAQTASATITVDNFTGNGVQTIFTLSTTPTSINQTSVNYNGATVLRSDYSLTGANITFSSAPANGSLIEVTTTNLTSGGGGGGGASSAAAVGYSLIFGG